VLYVFYAAVYIQANLEDDIVKEALKTVSGRCTQFSMLR